MAGDRLENTAPTSGSKCSVSTICCSYVPMITVIAQSLPLRLLKMVAVIIAVMIVAMGDEMIEVMAVVYFVIRVGVRFIAMFNWNVCCYVYVGCFVRYDVIYVVLLFAVRTAVYNRVAHRDRPLDRFHVMHPHDAASFGDADRDRRRCSLHQIIRRQVERVADDAFS